MWGIAALLASFRGAISILVDNYEGEDIPDTLFNDPCPKEWEEVWEFTARVVETFEKAVKASKQQHKKTTEAYRTALLEGCFRDGQVMLEKKRKESDTDLIARITAGLIRGQVNLENDKWLRVLWNQPK